MVVILMLVILTTAAAVVGCGVRRRVVGEALIDEMRDWNAEPLIAPQRSSQDAA